MYTLPAIHDPATGVYLADSNAIAEYLEKTYPTPGRSLFPDDTVALQSLVDGAVGSIAARFLWKIIIPDVLPHLNPPSAEHWRREREKEFGVPIENIAGKGEEGKTEWAALKAGWGTVDAWYERSGGPFILGETISWADFLVASWLIWERKMWGEESEKWRDVASWHHGRWQRLLNDLHEYERID